MIFGTYSDLFATFPSCLKLGEAKFRSHHVHKLSQYNSLFLPLNTVLTWSSSDFGYQLASPSDKPVDGKIATRCEVDPSSFEGAELESTVYICKSKYDLYMCLSQVKCSCKTCRGKFEDSC